MKGLSRNGLTDKGLNPHSYKKQNNDLQCYLKKLSSKITHISAFNHVRFGKYFVAISLHFAW